MDDKKQTIEDQISYIFMMVNKIFGSLKALSIEVVNQDTNLKPIREDMNLTRSMFFNYTLDLEKRIEELEKSIHKD